MLAGRQPVELSHPLWVAFLLRNLFQKVEKNERL